MVRPPSSRTSLTPTRRAAERALRVGLALGWAALVWALLTLPPPPGAREIGAWLPWPLAPAADKIGHGLLFLVQTVLVHRALERHDRARRGAAILAAALLTLAYGGATELRQRAVAGRDADGWDFAADAAGVVAAIAAVRLSANLDRGPRSLVRHGVERGADSSAGL